MSGRVERLWVKLARRGSMEARAVVRLVPGLGVEGSADRGGRRQVSVLALEGWEEALLELGADLDPAARRANLLLSGVALQGAGGRVLALGPCRVRILGELEPCERMDEALPGLEEALSPAWRGGVYGEVLRGGEVRAGDAAWLEPDEGVAPPSALRGS